MKGLSPLLLALLAAPLCSALVVGAAARAPLQRIAPACTMVEADATSQFLDDLEEAAVDDPLGDSEFVRWYRFEKAKEKYDKENPRDVVGEAAEKLKGPVTSLAILGGGFYAIPLVRGIADGMRAGGSPGQIITNIFSSLGNPTASLDNINNIIP